MDELSALLGLGMDTDDDTQALADRLRGRKRAADMFALSPTESLSRMAQGEQASVLASAKQAGGLRKAMAERKQQEMLHDETITAQMDRLRYQQGATDTREANRLESEQEVARITAGMGMKPSAKTQETYLGTIELLGQVDKLDSMYSGLDEGQRAMLNQPIKDVGLQLAGSLLPKGGKNVLADKFVYPDKGVQTYLAQGDRMTQRLSNLAAGLALTGFEIEERDKWSPFAPGLVQEQRQLRLNNLHSEFGKKIKMQQALHKGFLPDVGFLTEGQEPSQERTVAPAASGDGLDEMSDEEVDALHRQIGNSG